MKLYEFAPSPSARRVTIFAKELDIELESINVDIRGGENLQSEFTDKSANGRVPMIQTEDGDYICESVAICRYLEAINKKDDTKSLFGDSILEQTKVEMWQRIVEFQGLFPAMQAFRNISGLYKDRENIVPQWGEESKSRVIDFLPSLDKQLKENNFIAGNDFSIADITGYVLISFCEKIEVSIPAELAHLTRWYQSIKSRPCFEA